MRSERPDLGSDRPYLGSERPDLGLERSDLRSQRPNLGFGRFQRGGDENETPDRKNCPVWNHRHHRPLPKKYLQSDHQHQGA